MNCDACDKESTYTVVILCNLCKLAVQIPLCEDHLNDPGPALQVKHVCR